MSIVSYIATHYGEKKLNSTIRTSSIIFFSVSFNIKYQTTHHDLFDGKYFINNRDGKYPINLRVSRNYTDALR